MRTGTPRFVVLSLLRIKPPITAVSPSFTITLVSAMVVLMMMPPCTVAWDARSDTSGWTSMVILFPVLMCGVTLSLIPIVVSCVTAFPAKSCTMSGICLPTTTEARSCSPS